MAAGFARYGAAAEKHAELVAIDVGHTLKAPGATSARGGREFDFNRDLALLIERSVRDAGLRTLLINRDGSVARLAERTALAKGAQFFLSVHHDSVQPKYLSPWTFDGIERLRSSSQRGFSLFVSRLNISPEESLACASAIGRAMREGGFTPSRYHSEQIPGENRPFADEANGVHYYDALEVLKTARSPAVLLEAGVITDPEEELKLREPRTQEAMAAAVASGLESCRGRFRARN